MSEKPVVFVCMVECCNNSGLYSQLITAEDLDVRSANCRGYCGLGNRVDVYDAQGRHMFALQKPENPNLAIETLGEDPIGKILAYAIKS